MSDENVIVKLLKILELSPELLSKFEVPEKIYHYTTVESLMKIITEKPMGMNGIWFSNAKFLNDYQEIQHGNNLVQNQIQSIIGQANNINLTFDYFIASFSLQNDMLNQWRCYAKNGAGVCIEFDLKNGTYFKGLNDYLIGCKVIYEDNLKEELICKIVSLLKDSNKSNEIATLTNGISTVAGSSVAGVGIAAVGSLLFPIIGAIIAPLVITSAAAITKMTIDQQKAKRTTMVDFCKNYNLDNLDDNGRLISACEFLLPFFKSIQFQEEQEYRYIYYAKHDSDCFKSQRYRTSSYDVIVPYLHSQLFVKGEDKKLDISRVTLGPTLNSNFIKDSIQNLLNNNGYNNVKVDESAICYRG